VGQGHKQKARTNLGLGITQAAEGSNNAVMKDIHNQMYFLLLAASLPYTAKYRINFSTTPHYTIPHARLFPKCHWAFHLVGLKAQQAA
jgi:hypothetical protein